MPPMTIGQAVKRTRGARTQTAVANAMGTYQSAVSEIERDEQALTVQGMIDLERAAGRPPGFLLAQIGYLSPAATVLELLAVDPDLTDGEREVLTSIYEGMVTGKRAGKQRRA